MITLDGRTNVLGRILQIETSQMVINFSQIAIASFPFVIDSLTSREDLDKIFKQKRPIEFVDYSLVILNYNFPEIGRVIPSLISTNIKKEKIQVYRYLGGSTIPGICYHPYHVVSLVPELARRLIVN
jgi:hypothetical protein